MAFKLDGKTLPTDVAFTSNGINYPANWLRLTTLDEKKAIGITEVADAPWYDQRFYTAVDTPKSLADTTKTVDSVTYTTDGLKTKWLKIQKTEANNLLSVDDWYVTRKAEKEVAIPSSIATYRDSVRTIYETRKSEINAVSDVAALITLVDSTITKWPNLPS